MPASDKSVSPSDFGETPYASNHGVDPSKPPQLPYPLGAFLLIEQIGGGGFAEVYRASHLETGKEYAIKVLRPQYETDPATVERFLREARIAAKLTHPGIIPVRHTGVSSGRHFHVMSLEAGESLLTVLKKSPCTPMEAVDWMIQLSEAVEYIHDHEVLHRDLKPSNILIDHASRRALVMDFGLAKSADCSILTRPLDVLGTEPYMPPEQADPMLGEFSVATDVYGLGATFYEMLTGRPPFPHRRRGWRDMLRRHEIRDQIAWDSPEPPSVSNPNVNPDLDKICLKCLRKSPFDRYSTVRELMNDLESFRAGKPVVVRPISMMGRLVRFRQRRPGLAYTIGALIMSVIASLGIAFSYAEETKELTNQTVTLKTELGAEVKKSELARHENRVAQSQATSARTEAATARAEEKRARTDERAAIRQRRLQQYLAEIRQAPDLWKDGEAHDLRQLLARHEIEGADDVRGPEWYYWRAQLRATEDVINCGCFPHSIALSPSGRLLAATTDTHLFVWSMQDHDLLLNEPIGNGRRSPAYLEEPPSPKQAVAFSSDERFVAATCAYDARDQRTGSVRVWSLDSLETALSVQDDPRLGGCAVTFSPDGEFVLAGGFKRSFRCWNIATQTESVPDLPGNHEAYDTHVQPFEHERLKFTSTNMVFELRFEQPPLRLISSSRFESSAVWTWPHIGPDPSYFSKCGGRLVWPSRVPYTITRSHEDYDLHICRPDRKKSEPIPGTSNNGNIVVNGNSAITWGIENIVRLWTAPVEPNRGLSSAGEFRGATDHIRCVCLNETHVAAADQRGDIHIWPRSADSSRPAAVVLNSNSDDRFRSPSKKLEGEWLDRPSRFALRHAASNETIATIPGAQGQTIAVAYSPDDKYVAISFSNLRMTNRGLKQNRGARPLVTVWSTSPAAKIADFQPTERLANRGFCFSHDGRLFAIALGKEGVSIVRTSDGGEAHHLEIPDSTAVAFSPTARFIAVSAPRRSAVWDLQTKRWAFEAEEAAMQFVFDSQEKVIVGNGGNIAGARPFAGDLETGAQIFGLLGNENFTQMELSKDGRRLFALRGHTLYVYSTEDRFGQPLLTLPTSGGDRHSGSFEDAFQELITAR